MSHSASSWFSLFVKAVVCTTLACLFSGITQAQDLRQYKEYDRYRYLPRLPRANEDPKPLPDGTKEAKGDPEVLVKELKGLVFIDDPEKVVKEGVAVAGVEIRSDSRLQLLRCHAFSQITEGYLGKPVSILRLNELVRDIIIFYRKNDQPVVDVSIPAEQDITDGVVQIVVTEARVGKVLIKGPCYFDPCVLARQPFISSGDVICESVLTEDLTWLYRNPFRTVDLELTPGENRGETDVIFNVKDQLPWRIYAGYEDTGTRPTGLERTIYGINWFNAFGRDDQFGYQYTASSDFNRLGAHSAFYSKALQNRDIISVYGSYADFNTPIPGFGSSSGYTWQLLTRGYRELDRIGNYKHGVTAGFDVKRTNTDLEFGGFQIFGQPVGIGQFMAGYQGRYDDACGSWTIGADTYVSPGDLGQYNTSPVFESARPGANAYYLYARGFLERRRSISSRFDFVGRFTGQLSDASLIVTEQLGLGGYNSIRGYDMFAATADSGYFANLELQTKPISPGMGDDELRLLAFYDFGKGYNRGASSVDMSSVGVGTRYVLKSKVELRADYGWQLEELATIPSPSSRIHVGFVLSR